MHLTEAAVSPALEQVRDFPAWGEFIADAVRVNLLKLLCMLCGKHHITWVNDAPDASCRLWRLLLIDKSGGQPSLTRLQGGLFQCVFGRFVFQVGIHNFEQLWNTLRCWLSEIQKDYGLLTSMVDSRLNHRIIALI